MPEDRRIVPAGIPAGYLFTDELCLVFDVIVDLPIGVDEWAVLKLALLDAWPHDPWAARWDASSDTPSSDDVSSEEDSP